MKNRLTIILFTLVTAFLLSGTLAFAQDDCSGYRVQIPIPGTGTCIDDTDRPFVTYLEAWYRLFFAVLAIAAVAMIVIGGIRWSLALGNPERISAARQTITDAITGLILGLLAFTILQFIDPQLVDNSFEKLTPTERVGITRQAEVEEPIESSVWGCCVRSRPNDTPICQNTVLNGCTDVEGFNTNFLVKPCDQASECSQTHTICTPGEQCDENRYCTSERVCKNCILDGESCGSSSGGVTALDPRGCCTGTCRSNGGITTSLWSCQ